MHKLFTVLDTFLITGRGLVCVPAPLYEEYSGPRLVEVELRRPGGSVKTAFMTFEHVFQTPPPKEPRWGCVIRFADKQDVPIGTEIWISPDS